MIDWLIHVHTLVLDPPWFDKPGFHQSLRRNRIKLLDYVFISKCKKNMPVYACMLSCSKKNCIVTFACTVVPSRILLQV